MKFIEEIVVEEFLPTFRSMLAAELRERDFTQHEVAEALGISQSAVSKYAHGSISQQQAVLDDARVQHLVERIAEGLASGDMSSVQALVETEILIRQLERGDLLATLHEAAMPALAEYDGDFDIHDPESNVRTTEQVLSSVRRGVRTLTSASGFAGLIPNVGSNLAECLPEAAGIEDVAAIPGRIFDIKGRATVPSDPEFGVSEHVAGVLLSAREADTDVCAAVNIRYDDDIVQRFADAGYETVEFDPDAPTDPIVTALEGAAHEDTFVLYQTGGYGIEPITYVLAPDAPTVARVVREVLL